MDRVLFEKYYEEQLNKKHKNLQKYFDYENKVFYELTKTVIEISHCLLLDLNKAAMTLTNHFLERLLKSSLINHEVGLEPISIDSWNEVFETPFKKYSSINLGKSIELCEKCNLINQEERDVLNSKIRDQIRNGFSHADSSKILTDFPDIMCGFYGSFDEKEKTRKVNLNQKIIPSIQSVLIDNFAKQNAFDYFEFVFELMINIENRLEGKSK